MQKALIDNKARALVRGELYYTVDWAFLFVQNLASWDFYLLERPVDISISEGGEARVILSGMSIFFG